MLLDVRCLALEPEAKARTKLGGGGAIEIVTHYLADCKLFILMSSTHGVERVLRR